MFFKHSITYSTTQLARIAGIPVASIPLPNILRLREVSARSSEKEREITELFILDLKFHTIFRIYLQERCDFIQMMQHLFVNFE